MKKLHPAIHTIRAVAKHLEQEFGTFKRGQRHTSPKKDIDVRKLHVAYRESGFHHMKPGRKVKTRLLIGDYATDGSIKLGGGKVMQRWKYLRTFVRAKTEDWEDWINHVDDEPPQGDQPLPVQVELVVVGAGGVLTEEGNSLLPQEVDEPPRGDQSPSAQVELGGAGAGGVLVEGNSPLPQEVAEPGHVQPGAAV